MDYVLAIIAAPNIKVQPWASTFLRANPMNGWFVELAGYCLKI